MAVDVEKIYFDMDDTVADFTLGLIEICHIIPMDQAVATKEYDDIMWSAIRSTGDFYYELKECEPGASLFHKLRELYGDKVEILTAVPKPKRNIPEAAADKFRWAAEHFGADVVVNIAHSKEEKQAYVNGPGCFLVDDMAQNIERWRTAGGTGIRFLKDDPISTNEEIARSGLLERG